MNPQDVKLDQQSGRVQVLSAQRFQSNGMERHILVLRDNATEREYLVVMGGGVIDITQEYDPATKQHRDRERP